MDYLETLKTRKEPVPSLRSRASSELAEGMERK
jgi:hypothetical protein